MTEKMSINYFNWKKRIPFPAFVEHSTQDRHLQLVLLGCCFCCEMTIPIFVWISCGSPVLFQKGRKCTLQCDQSSDAPETLGHILVSLLQASVASEALGKMFPVGTLFPKPPSDTRSP